jgi:hypothetical protein
LATPKIAVHLRQGSGFDYDISRHRHHPFCEC